MIQSQIKQQKNNDSVEEELFGSDTQAGAPDAWVG